MLNELGKALGAAAQASRQKEWIPLLEVEGKGGVPWLVAYGHAPGVEQYAPRLGFHRGKKPVNNVTTGNYFEVLLENPQEELSMLGTVLERFLSDQSANPLPLSLIHRFVLWCVGGSTAGSTAWKDRPVASLSVGSLNVSKKHSYGLVRQSRDSGLLTVIETSQSDFSSAFGSGGQFDFNWLCLRWSFAADLAQAIKEFSPPQVATQGAQES